MNSKGADQTAHCAGMSVPLLFTNPRRQVFLGQDPYMQWLKRLKTNDKLFLVSLSVLAHLKFRIWANTALGEWFHMGQYENS